MTIKIKVENLNFYYGSFQALKDINIDVHENRITALIGPSGCGKSTFIKTIDRMYDLIEDTRAEGTIAFEGINVLDESTDVVELRKRIGMVFQKPNPFPKSIFENVAYGLKIQGIKDKKLIADRVEKALVQADLWNEVKDNLNKSSLTLSGGQQQRLCIARTLAVEPSIILMDEPTSALDPISTAKIEELIHHLKKDYTIIIVTHNMQQASRISDYTAFFYMGELIEFDKTKKIFTNPEKKRTENYITGRFG